MSLRTFSLKKRCLEPSHYCQLLLGGGAIKITSAIVSVKPVYSNCNVKVCNNCSLIVIYNKPEKL